FFFFISRRRGHTRSKRDWSSDVCSSDLELGLEWLDGFHEVLIYPAPFVVDDEWEDDIGLVHNQRIVQSGQSWQQGPIVLNWLDIQDSFDASGFNLIIHEVAHKLDTRKDRKSTRLNSSHVSISYAVFCL